MYRVLDEPTTSRGAANCFLQLMSSGMRSSRAVGSEVQGEEISSGLP